LKCGITLALGLFFAFPSRAVETNLLWEIGTADRDNKEFALAPGDYAKYRQDGFFVPGESDPRKDWPYVQPGPDDAWAGGREHTFIVLFGVKTAPQDGSCRLVLDLLDAQRRTAPALKIEVNGESFERSVTPGAGDETIQGHPDQGKPSRVKVEFPVRLLKAGDNQVRITTIKGSWLLYDRVGLEGPSGIETAKVTTHTVVERVQPLRALQDRAGKLFQPVWVTVRHTGPSATCMVRIESGFGAVQALEPGTRVIPALTLAVTNETQRKLEVLVDEKPLLSQQVSLKPVPQLTVYVLPHSHTDIGYTEIQGNVEKKQVQNLVDGIAAAKRTANLPTGARFVWNVEVLWAADLYLQRQDEAQRKEFLDAVRQGQVALNGMYLNELTGLCRPEELVRLFRFSTELAERCGVKIDTAMISDVPGYTWGTVAAMAQAGIKYFSTAPNYFDRIGTILREWENKPFYWVGPDGETKVLVWIPYWGYAMSHRYGRFSRELVEDLMQSLEQRAYPYDIAYVRWSGHGDNAVPDPEICAFIANWNEEFKYPRFVIASASEAFHAFEQKHGDKLPKVRGDWTPYWEDGAGSSAFETAVNRTTADRLSQAETLFALLEPGKYPAAAFDEAWKHVLLYSEHTWGAWCSVSGPERPETREQWEVKRGYATTADRLSHELLDKAVAGAGEAHPGTNAASVQALDLWNTRSWPRTELVLLPPSLSKAGDRVLDEEGEPVPSQRLASGELAFLAKDVPPLAARRYGVTAGTGQSPLQAAAHDNYLDNGRLQIRVDKTTGGIVSLKLSDFPDNFADLSGGEELNDYLYLPGDDLKNLKHSGPVKIRVGESGPLVASLIIDSDAPGCRHLQREIRVVAGQDTLELINRVDKERLKAASYMAKEGKESLNFAFPFNVPEGDVLLDIPLAMMRPEADQMPSACKNWFTVGRWADVSNAQRGITWVTLDAPLLQVGGLTATLLNSQTNPDVWRKKVDRTQRLYSWAMNNHWGTNYRANQEGPTVFRFILRPHKPGTPADASRLAGGFGQPLLPLPASAGKVQSKPLLEVSPADVLVSSLKPADAGGGFIVRLLNTASDSRAVALKWNGAAPKSVLQSDTSEKAGAADPKPTIPGHGLLTLLVQP
jgi:hypothetical protein